MTFQVPSNAIPGMDKQKTLLDILKGKEKVYTKKMEIVWSDKPRTENEEKMILISRELDRCYRI